MRGGSGRGFVLPGSRATQALGASPVALRERRGDVAAREQHLDRERPEARRTDVAIRRFVVRSGVSPAQWT